jgi:class 3 adenylate cyclase
VNPAAIVGERRFLPAAVRALASAHPTGSASVDLPGVVLVADLVGFTPTVLRLDGLGRHGHAALTELLDRSYSAMDSIIAEHDGQTLVRIGDATVAVFTGDDPDDVRRRARQAADTIAALRGAQPDLPPLRVGLAAGLSRLLLIPVGERRVWTLMGDPPALAARAQADSAPDSVNEHPSVAAWNGPVGGFPVESTTGSLRDLLPRDLAGDAASTEWIGEVRPLTVMFCQLVDEHGLPLADPDLIVDAVAELHQTFLLGNATIDQVIWDEKGLQIVAMFGSQADRSPEHAPLRAVDTALRAVEAAAGLGLSLTIGVATGTTVIGAFGDDRHRTFTSLGPTVNLAARLAGLERGQVQVDAETARLAGTGLDYRAVRHELKGLGEMDVFVPTRHADTGRPTGPSVTARGIVARDRELEQIAERLDAARRNCRPRPLVLEGAPGAGKSTLIAVGIAEARSLGLGVVEFRGHPILGATPLRGVSQYVREAVPDGEVHTLAALYEGTTSPVAPGPARVAAAAGLHRDLRRALPEGPIIVVVHDAHWIDTASLELLGSVLAERPDAAVVIESRSPTDDVVWSALVGRDDADVVELDGLGREAVGELISRRLGVRAVPDSVVEGIHRHAAGNPFLVEQLVDAAVVAGEIERVGDLVRLHSSVDAFQPVAVPTDVHRVVAGTIDCLDPLTALTLKAAAILGTRFTAERARQLHPMAPTAEQVDAALAELVARGLLVADGDLFGFQHSISRDVAASLLTPAQHRSLHRRAAEMIEAERPDDPDAVELLAHHWSEADDAARALPYLSDAALRSGPVFAGPQTARYVSAARDLAARHGLAVDEVTRARWHIALAEAARSAGDLERHRQELAQGLFLLDVAIPETAGEQLRAIGNGVLRQVRHRLRPSGADVGERAHERAEAALTALRVVNLMASEDDDAMLTLFVALSSLNLAEEGAVNAELTSAFGMAEVGSRSLGLRRVADVYGRLLDRAVEDASPSGVAEAKVFRGIRLIGDGQLARASQVLAEARAAYDDLGSPYIAEVVDSTAGYADCFANDLDAALDRYRRLGISAAMRGDPRMSAWGCNGEAMALAAMGRDVEAQERLDAGRDLPADEVSSLFRTVCRALIDARSEQDLAVAERSVRSAAEALLATPPSFFYLLCQYVFLDEAIAIMRRRSESEAPRSARSLRRLHRRVLVSFGVFRMLFPVGRPSYHAALVRADELRRPTVASRLRRQLDDRRLGRAVRRVGVEPMRCHSRLSYDMIRPCDPTEEPT